MDEPSTIHALTPVPADLLHRSHPHRGGYPPPPQLAEVQAAAALLCVAELTPEHITTPATYRLADVRRILNAAARPGGEVPEPVTVWALAFAGHGPQTGHPQLGPVVRLVGSGDLAQLDEAVLAVAAGLGVEVTTRRVVRARRWTLRAGPGLAMWLVRGSLMRLEAAGLLRRSPEARFAATTRWELASGATPV